MFIDPVAVACHVATLMTESRTDSVRVLSKGSTWKIEVTDETGCVTTWFVNVRTGAVSGRCCAVSSRSKPGLENFCIEGEILAI